MNKAMYKSSNESKSESKQDLGKNLESVSEQDLEQELEQDLELDLEQDLELDYESVSEQELELDYKPASERKLELEPVSELNIQTEPWITFLYILRVRHKMNNAQIKSAYNNILQGQRIINLSIEESNYLGDLINQFARENNNIEPNRLSDFMQKTLAKLRYPTNLPKNLDSPKEKISKQKVHKKHHPQLAINIYLSK